MRLILQLVIVVGAGGFASSMDCCGVGIDNETASQEEFDAVVIGAGGAGMRAAL